MQKKKPTGLIIVVLIAVAIAALAIFSTVTKKGGVNDQKMTAGKPFPKVALLYNTSESHAIIAQAIQAMWSRELGVNVELVNKEWKVYQKDMQDLNYNIGRAGWIGDYPDPNTFLDMWMSDNGNNQTGWKNPWYDSQLNTANREMDRAKRMKMLAALDSFIVNDELPIMPIYFYVNKNLVKPYVKGVTYNIEDLHPLKTVWIEKNGKEAPPDQQVLTVNNLAEPETLDPGLMAGNVEFFVAMQLFEGLVSYDPETLAPRPGVAESWDISPDGITYTFHLRRNAKWTNGDPVTARDFAFAWERVLNPETGSEYAYQLYKYIKNGEAYNQGKLKDFSQVGIKVIDDYTIQTILDHPTAYWLDIVAFHTLMPVNPKCVSKYKDRWTRPENIVTNGAFKMESWEPKKSIVVVKNPQYWAADGVKLQKAVINAIEKDITSVNMFETGETDWVRVIPLAFAGKYLHDPTAHITPLLGTYYYRFNVTKAPFDDKRVRMAFNLAVDKQAICKEVTKLGETPATTYVPPGILGYTPPVGQGYNPERARQLLREAGYSVVEKK